MFTKGPRFDPLKPSTNPPPNAYNLPSSDLEPYKRGAFLDKADRFPKGNSSLDVAAENYAALQRKVDDLERVHTDAKKTHNAELERLRHDHKHLTDKFDKQSKHNASLQATIQSLNKAATADHSEIKQLRHKLRLLEVERVEREKAMSKLQDPSEHRKALHALETKRADDLRERDRRIAELDKSLQSEKSKRELAQSKLSELKSAMDEQTSSLKDALRHKDQLLQDAVGESRQAHDKFAHLLDDRTHQEQQLLQQLDHHRILLNNVAKEYAHLASQSISRAQYDKLKRDYHSLQFRQFRTERKLANSESQVVELTHLIRHNNDKKIILTQQLEDATSHIRFLSSLHPSSTTGPPDLPYDILARLETELSDEHKHLRDVLDSTAAALSTCDRLQAERLTFATSVILKEHNELQAVLEQRQADLSSALASHEAIASRLESIQKEKAVQQDALEAASLEAADAKASAAILESQLAETQRQLDDLDAVHAVALKKEQETIQRLASTIQKNRMAEEALRTDIEHLTADLAAAEAYEEAYSQLYDQIGSLIARNQIAEEEANRISKFNAEILGHQNPAQRIMYVDRIRTELAETKMRVAELVRDQENAATENHDLRHELDMYKSVKVPVDQKARTNLTRLTRRPLVNLTHSLNGAEMTVDELM